MDDRVLAEITDYNHKPWNITQAGVVTVINNIHTNIVLNGRYNISAQDNTVKILKQGNELERF